MSKILRFVVVLVIAGWEIGSLGAQDLPSTSDSFTSNTAAELAALRARVARLEQAENDSAGGVVQTACVCEEAGCLTCATKPKSQSTRYPTVKLSGFLQLDSAWFGESASTRAAFGDIADTTAVRRARVAVSGDVYQNIGYTLDYDFAASGHPSFRNHTIEFREVPLADQLIVGLFKVPFQFDAIMTARHFTFFERAPFFTFAPFRKFSVGTTGTLADDRATWALSGYRPGTNGFAAAESDDGYGVASRLTMVPWNNGGRVMHCGFGYIHEGPADNRVQYDAKLGFFVDEEPGGSTTSIPPLVDTGMILSRRNNLFNIELAGTLGPLHYQGEYGYTLVDQIGDPGLVFSGGYAQIGWFLTGETRPYDQKSAVFMAVQPRCDVGKGGIGAWEIAVRGTYLDLNDENIQGGQLSSAEFSVSWYLNKNVSLRAGGIWGFIDDPVVGEANLGIGGGRMQILY